jgi:hypothetical protein
MCKEAFNRPMLNAALNKKGGPQAALSNLRGDEAA